MLAQCHDVKLIVGIKGTCARLWECPGVSRVLHEVSALVLVEL